MKAVLKKQIKRIIKESEEAGIKIKIQESLDNSEIIMIGCPENRKVVMLVVDQLSRATKNTLRAFTINLKKWNWADAEGFTDKDLIGTLSDQVFKEIKLSEIIQKLG
jgi:hypothetical protein